MRYKARKVVIVRAWELHDAAKAGSFLGQLELSAYRYVS